MKAKKFPYKKIVMGILLYLGLSSTAFSQGQTSDTTIYITAKDLQAMPASQFYNAHHSWIFSSCIVTLEVDKDLVEYKIKTQSIPDKLKEQLGRAKKGELVIVEKRMALVEGNEKKLPSIIYSIVD